MYTYLFQVEQLASQTGEETLVLTASISDGSLSELGTESGKVFLKDHDETMSQFLGFCVNSKFLYPHKFAQEQIFQFRDLPRSFSQSERPKAPPPHPPPPSQN